MMPGVRYTMSMFFIGDCGGVCQIDLKDMKSPPSTSEEHIKRFTETVSMLKNPRLMTDEEVDEYLGNNDE